MNTSHDLQYYIDYVKRQLGAGILHLEMSDEAIGDQLLDAFEELRPYIDSSTFITVPYSPMIDLSGFKHAYIVQVYRSQGLYNTSNSGDSVDGPIDPGYIQFFTYASGFGGYNLNSYLLNLGTYMTYQQIRNTMNSELDFKYDKQGEKLYITSNYGNMEAITIEYVPLFEKVDDITDDYWINIYKKMCVAYIKIAEGRIKTRYVQSNALYSDDGASMLAEGNEELKELRSFLDNNDLLFLPMD